jgi:hypothetical protein
VRLAEVLRVDIEELTGSADPDETARRAYPAAPLIEQAMMGYGAPGPLDGGEETGREVSLDFLRAQARAGPGGPRLRLRAPRRPRAADRLLARAAQMAGGDGLRCLVSYRAIGGLAVFTRERQAYGRSIGDEECAAESAILDRLGDRQHWRGKAARRLKRSAPPDQTLTRQLKRSVTRSETRARSQRPINLGNATYRWE